MVKLFVVGEMVKNEIVMGLMFGPGLRSEAAEERGMNCWHLSVATTHSLQPLLFPL